MDVSPAAAPLGAPAGGRPRGRLGVAGVAALVAVGLATASAVAWSGGDIIVAVAPLLVAALVWAALTLPLRLSVGVLLAAMLSLDHTDDAQGLWHSPVAIVGDLLRSNVDAVFPQARGVKVSGMEVLICLLVAVAMRRRTVGDPIDRAGHASSGGAATAAVGLLLAGVAFATVVGIGYGGSWEVWNWQARPLLQIAVLFVLFHVGYRGPADHALFGRVIVGSALVKAAFAVGVRLWVKPAPGAPKLELTTNHGDSILFAMAMVILLACAMERTDRRRVKRCALLLPLIGWGMLANNRRLAWVELGFALGAVYLLSPWRPWKRWITRSTILAAPLIALYLAAGWNSNSTVFFPVGRLRSTIDTKVDRSSWFREVENFNLMMSMRDRPVLGRGLGHYWTEFYHGDDITSIFPQYRAEPHNQVLGLLLFAGPLAFSAIWSIFAVTAFLAVRTYRRAASPADRAAALACVAAVLVNGVQAYGDMGQYLIQYRLCAAFALAAAGKLAVATGAWPVRARPQRSVLVEGAACATP